MRLLFYPKHSRKVGVGEDISFSLIMRTSDRNSQYIEEEFKNMKFANQIDSIIHSMITSEAIIKTIIDNIINSQSKPPSDDAVAALNKVKELSNVANSITSGIMDSIINNQQVKGGRCREDMKPPKNEKTNASQKSRYSKN